MTEVWCPSCVDIVTATTSERLIRGSRVERIRHYDLRGIPVGWSEKKQPTVDSVAMAVCATCGSPIHDVGARTEAQYRRRRFAVENRVLLAWMLALVMGGSCYGTCGGASGDAGGELSGWVGALCGAVIAGGVGAGLLALLPGAWKFVLAVCFVLATSLLAVSRGAGIFRTLEAAWSGPRQLPMGSVPGEFDRPVAAPGRGEMNVDTPDKFLRRFVEAALAGQDLSKVAGIEELDGGDLRLVRNSVFARHGRPFQDATLAANFYEGEGELRLTLRRNPGYGDRLLSPTDRANLAFLRRAELARPPQGR